MNIAVRLACTDDKAAIWRLYESAMRPHIESIWEWSDDWQAADFEKAFSASLTGVVEVDSEFCGYLQLDINDGHVYLRMLVLTSHARSRGIGAKLLATLTQLCQQARYALHLRVFRVNGAAKRFYEREGWRVKAEEDAFFVMTHLASETTRRANASHALSAKDVEKLIKTELIAHHREENDSK